MKKGHLTLREAFDELLDRKLNINIDYFDPDTQEKLDSWNVTRQLQEWRNQRRKGIYPTDKRIRRELRIHGYILAVQEAWTMSEISTKPHMKPAEENTTFNEKIENAISKAKKSKRKQRISLHYMGQFNLVEIDERSTYKSVVKKLSESINNPKIRKNYEKNN